MTSRDLVGRKRWGWKAEATGQQAEGQAGRQAGRQAGGVGRLEGWVAAWHAQENAALVCRQAGMLTRRGVPAGLTASFMPELGPLGTSPSASLQPEQMAERGAGCCLGG